MKRKKIFSKVLMSAILSTVLCIGMGVPVLAGPGTEEEPAKASVTKELTMPEGTTTPDADFEFKFTPIAKDGVLHATRALPTIADKTISFDDEDAGTTAAGVKRVSDETGDILAGISWTALGAGDYVYDVEETADTYTPGNTETLTYSRAKYRLTVRIDNTSTGGLYVESVSCERLLDDSGNAPESPEKVDPTPDAKGMKFTNTYIKQGTGDPSAPGESAAISKTVTGTGADRTKYFSYQLNVTKPATVSAPVTYKAYVMEGSVVVSSLDDNLGAGANKGNDAQHGDYIEVPAGSPVNINLKHGQTLLLADIHVGAKYTVNETGDPDYTPSVAIMTNGTASSDSAGEGESLSTGDARVIGDSGANTADYSNAKIQIALTGVLINNLPFIMVFVLAGGAFAAYIAVKSRKYKANR